MVLGDDFTYSEGPGSCFRFVGGALCCLQLHKPACVLFQFCAELKKLHAELHTVEA